MTVQTFKANSIQEALQMVRESLGPHATILETQTVQAGIWPWFKRPSHVLVSASDGIKVPSRLPDSPEPRHVVPGQETAATPDWTNTPTVTARETSTSYVEQLYQREQSATLSSQSELEPAKTIGSGDNLEPMLFEQLRTAGLSHSAIESLHQAALACNPLASGEILKKELLRALSRSIHTTAVLPGSGLQSLDMSTADRVLFYGLSGSGKSTTVAKLATQLQLRQDRSVAVIEIQQGDQIRSSWLLEHLDQLGIQNARCIDLNALGSAFAQFQSADYILVDTPGVTLKNKAQQNWFNAMTQQINAHQNHLVCNATCHYHHIADVMQSPYQIQPTSLVLTKLDEIKTAGHLFSLLEQTNLPISLLTTGPQLADGFEDVNPELLAQFITKLIPQLSHPNTQETLAGYC